jgi:hypothetical protein
MIFHMIIVPLLNGPKGAADRRKNYEISAYP